MSKWEHLDLVERMRKWEDEFRGRPPSPRRIQVHMESEGVVYEDDGQRRIGRTYEVIKYEDPDDFDRFEVFRFHAPPETEDLINELTALLERTLHRSVDPYLVALVLSGLEHLTVDHRRQPARFEYPDS